MIVKLRLLAVAIAFLLPTLAIARWSLTGAESAPVSLLSLPAQVGAWHATEEEQLSDEIWAIIEPDAHIVRLYEAPGRVPIWLYLGLYSGRTGVGKAAHDPEICYPAQGWEIVATRPRRVSLESSETLEATSLQIHNGVREEAVLYWFQPAARWPVGSAIEQFMRIYDAVTGRPQYAFVRFSGPSDGSARTGEDLAEFAREIAPEIRLAVESVGLMAIDQAPLADL